MEGTAPLRGTIAVIGGGLSGLSIAYRLRRRGYRVDLFEAQPQLGGKIKSERRGGYLLEGGPNGFQSNRVAILRLSKELGLGDQLISAQTEAKRRYLFVDGSLQALPASPPALLRSGLLRRGARARLLGELLLPASPSNSLGESVLGFARRRIGSGAAERFIDPFVTGVHAGDPEQLSVEAAFPSLPAWERAYGGLIRGAIRSGRARRRRGEESPKLHSFHGGMRVLIDALAMESFRGAGAGLLHRATPVHRLWQSAVGRHPRWHLESSAGRWEGEGVVVAGEAPAAARLFATSELLELATPLSEISYAPVGVALFAFPHRALPRPLDGFGLLVPKGEEIDLLGVLWSSTIFSGRAPDGYALLRVIFGGSRAPELLSMAEEPLRARLLRSLSIALGGPLPRPELCEVTRWPIGIPQYESGHRARLGRAERSLDSLPGLWLTGNGYYGVGLSDCVRRADALSELIDGELRAR